MSECLYSVGGCVKIGASSFYTSLKTVMSECLYSVAAFLFFRLCHFQMPPERCVSLIYAP